MLQPGIGPSPFTAGRRAEEEPAALRNIDRFIDDACDRKVDLKALGRLADLPRSAVSAAYRRSVGMPPSQYVLPRRVERARYLVQTTSKALGEVVYRCSSSSQAHFTDMLKQKIGATPGELRTATDA